MITSNFIGVYGGDHRRIGFIYPKDSNIIMASAYDLCSNVFGEGVRNKEKGTSLATPEVLERIGIERAKEKMSFSVGEIIMFFNIFIFIAAGFVFAWENCLYSMLTYFIAYKVIDIVLEGVNESKSIRIISDKAEEIGQQIIETMNTSVTYMDVVGGYSKAPKKLVYCIISRLEIVKMKELIKTIDPTAFLTIENVHDVEGVRIKKKHSF